MSNFKYLEEPKYKVDDSIIFEVEGNIAVQKVRTIHLANDVWQYNGNIAEEEIIKKY